MSSVLGRSTLIKNFRSCCAIDKILTCKNMIDWPRFSTCSCCSANFDALNSTQRQTYLTTCTRSLATSAPAMVSNNSINKTTSKAGKATTDNNNSQPSGAVNDLGKKFTKILNIGGGQTLPSIEMEDGSRLQTGTVATMLKNVERYNAGERDEVEQLLEECVPTLIHLGLFNLFSLEEWINTTTNPGRKFVGEKARAFLAAKDKTKT